MIHLQLSTHLKAEFDYIAEVIFRDYFGLEYQISYTNDQTELFLQFEDKKIMFNADFWQREHYLDADLVPKSVPFLEHHLLSEKDLPIMFGEAQIRLESKTIHCGPDLFASCFFMLTRWEEYVIHIRDRHGRFPGNASCAYRFNFLQRPVVNEMLELLWNLLVELGFNGQRKSMKYQVFATHDIDQLTYWNKPRRKKLVLTLAADLFKRKAPQLAHKRLKSYFDSNDPADTILYFVDTAQKNNCRALFYFIAGGTSVYENDYKLDSKDLFKKIDFLREKHVEIGLHPSYYSSDESERFLQEKTGLEHLSKQTIQQSRQHYLRLKIPATFRDLEAAGLQTDSSLYYSSYPGFRSGFCQSYRLFDFVQRRTLNLVERPLVVMDTCLYHMEPDERETKVRALKEKVKKYKGDFVFLWHNTNVSTPEWIGIQQQLENLFYGPE